MAGNNRRRRIKCSVHLGMIKGRVYYWNKQPMCKNCHARFTGGPRDRDGVRRGGVKVVKVSSAPKPGPKRGLLARLLGIR